MRKSNQQKGVPAAAGEEAKPSRPAAGSLWLRRAVTGVLALAFLAGLGLLLYPTVSELWNSHHQTQAVVTYAEQTSGMDEEARAAMWAAAVEYNAALAQKEGQSWVLSETELETYEKLLSVTVKGTMGYIEIPGLHVTLPIYHGTSEAVLQEGVGHLEGSSLPVGGESTHAVVSGHRGLPSAKLFSDLDKMQEGDRFYLHVLEEILAYEVDQILIVEPDELEALEIQPGQDLCTLVTCTPYGINSHRLLVRGHRVATPEPGIETDAPVVEPEVDNTIFAAAIIAAQVILLAVVVALWVRSRRRTRRYRKHAAHIKNRKHQQTDRRR